MTERVIDRALKWAEDKGWSQTAFAERLEVSPARVTNWKARGMPPAMHARVAEQLGCTLDELVQGRHDVAARIAAERAPTYQSPSITPIQSWEHASELPEGEFVFIPRLDVKLSGGHGHEQVEIEFTKVQPQAFRADWIRRERLRPNKLASMYATGNSMEPTIWDGDSLVVDTSDEDVHDGKVYALWYNGGERVKRLFRLPGGGLRIHSDNQEYPDIDLGVDSMEHVRIIGRVRHRAGKGGL